MTAPMMPVRQKNSAALKLALEVLLGRLRG